MAMSGHDERGTAGQAAGAQFALRLAEEALRLLAAGAEEASATAKSGSEDQASDKEIER